ncbi:hypothetical protein VB711_19070 [Cronbergia sp. UHCC 0137]|uniref:hypothetical protein n=1 Tax=Cronbergia sp. UHCC 0137 TaxID=3110239 RepID=UPI002B1FA70E|nr:hypothetical protein [Cronbergia sp. UHCC 0137]MEA5619930.1 hypothetical protein [Cronbergia sp. UHCC 0137]
MLGEKVIVYHPESNCFLAVGTITQEFETGDISFVVEGEISNKITTWDLNECGVIGENDPEYPQSMKHFQSSKNNKSTVMIFGSRSINTLPKEAIASLDKIIELKFNVIVGDAPGVDDLVQRYLKSRNYQSVTVYYAKFNGNGVARNNNGFPVIGVMGNYNQRDAKMRAIANNHYGLAIWDGVSRGTKTSIDLMKYCKVITIK